MKKLQLLLLTLWFLLAATGAAHADPITALVSAIATAWGSLGALGQLAVGLALKIGVGLIQKAQMKKGQEQQPVGVSGNMDVGGDNPASFIVGTFATAGQLEYVGTWGKVDKTPNAYLTQVISLGDLPYEEDGFVDMWVNGEKVTVDFGDTSYGDLGFPVTDFRVSGKDALWVKFYYGEQTTWDTKLVGAFADDPDRPWTTDMIGRGIPYAVVTGLYKRDVLTGPPRCVFVMKGIKLYDPRKDTTVGGSGPHRWGNYSTYEWSDNPKVIQYNAMRGIYYEGEWFYGGQGLLDFQLPVSSWFAAMNECDRLIALSGGGSEKNFRAGYEVKVDLEPIELCKILDRACNGRTAENAGIYKTVCGDPGLPVYFFTDEDIIVSEPQTYNQFPGMEKIFNGVHASYPEPEEAWSSKDAPPRYSLDLEEADDGRRLIANLAYEAAPFKFQVQRLMRAAIEANRRFRSHQAVFTPAAKLLEPLDVVSYTSARNGYTNKKFLLGAIDDLNNVNQSAAFSEIEPEDYDWSTDFQLPTTTGPVGRVKPEPRVLSGFGVFPDTVKDGGGADRRPAILLVWPWDDDDVAIRAVAFQVRRTGTTEIIFQGRYDQPEDGQVLLAPFSLLPAVNYEVRAMFISNSNIKLFDWSTWQAVTTPNVQIGSADILDGSITSAKIQDAAIIASKIQNEAVTNLKLAAGAVTEAKIAVDAVTAAVIKNGEVIASKIANGAIEMAKFASGLTPVEGPFATAPVTGNFEGRVATIGASPNAKLMRYTGGAWTAAVPAVDLTGQITSTQITDNAITTPKILAGAVVTASLAAGAVTATTIATDAVTSVKIQANAITSDKIIANAIGAKHLVVADFENLILDGTFDQALTNFTDIWVMNPDNFTNNSGGSAGDPPSFWVWAGDSITGKQSLVIDNKTVGGSGSSMYMETKDLAPCTAGDTLAWEIANRTTDGSSATGHFFRFYWFTRTGAAATTPSTDVVGNQSIPAAWNVRSGQVVVPTGATQFKVRIYNSSLGTTRYNIIDRVIVRKAKGASLIVDGTIIADHLAANSVTANALAANSVTAAKILAGTITGDRIAADTITGSKIAANTISGDLIVANAITARELILTDYSNIYSDYDFQAQSGFYTGSTPSFSGTSVVTRGRFALRLFANAAAQNTYSQWISIGQGEYYADVVANMGAATVGGGTATCILEFGTGVGTGAVTYVSQITVLSRTDSSSTARGGVAFTVGSGIKFFRAQFTRNAGGTEDAFFGGLMVRKKQNANLIVDGAITADHLSANSVTAGALAANSVTATALAANSVTAVKIAATTITADKLVLRTITGAQIDVGAVLTDNLALGSVTLVSTNSLAGGAWGGTNRDVSVTVAHGTGSPEVSIFGSAGLTVGSNGSGSVAWSITARASSTEINRIDGDLPDNKKGGSSMVAAHTPASGTSSTTYTIRLICSSPLVAQLLTIVVIVTKR